MIKGSLQVTRRGRAFWEESRTNPEKETDQAPRSISRPEMGTKEVQSQAAAGAKLKGGRNEGGARG